MIRRLLAWTWVLLLTICAGCSSLGRDAEVTQDQWEPGMEKTASSVN